MKTEEFLQLIHLTHKLHVALDEHAIDVSDFSFDQIDYDEVIDFVLICEMVNEMLHSRDN